MAVHTLYGSLYKIMYFISSYLRVIKLSQQIDLIADNMAIFGRVGTVQANCVNFSQFGYSKPLGHEESGRRPLLPKPEQQRTE